MADRQKVLKPRLDVANTLAEIEAIPSEDLTAAEFELLADFSARWFLRYVSELNPVWARMIDAAKVETRLESWRLLGGWTARTLEEARHINAPRHPLFEAGLPRMVETLCGVCETKFLPEIPGQRYCSNKCGFVAEAHEHEKAFRPGEPFHVIGMNAMTGIVTIEFGTKRKWRTTVTTAWVKERQPVEASV